MLPMSDTIKNNFLEELKFIKSMGSKIFLCPFINRPTCKTIGYYTIASLVMFTSFQLFLTLCFTGFGDWMEMINIAPNIGVCLISTIKYTKVHINRKLYGEIFEHFENDIWGNFIEDTPEKKAVIDRYRYISRLINRFMVYYSLPLIVAVDSFPAVIMFYEVKFQGKEFNYLLPFDAWYPFDKIKWYYLAYMWESFMTGVVISIYAFSNIINISYVAYICMELKVLCINIRCLITDDDISKITYKQNVERTHEGIKWRLRNIIQLHEYLTKISTGLSTVLGDVMLLSYTVGAIFMCLTAFSFTVVDDLYMSIRYFSFFVSLLCEMFDQCIIGQVLSDHSTKIAEAISLSEWIYADERTKKTLVIFMMSTQKPIVLTGNGYVVMNLDTFSNICSSSYQFFNLLRTVYHP